MDKEKQIEEMAKNVCHLDRTCDECMTSFECKAMTYAKRFYEAGYRKSSEVAREIFEEIEREINNALLSNYKVLPLIEQSEALWNRVNGKIDVLRGIEGYISELKKKYTEEG